MGIDACHPSRPIAVWMAHGTADPVVPYGGSAVLGFRSVADTVAGWTERNHCIGAPVQTFHQGDTDCEAQLRADSGVAVELCTIQGGSHTWPNGDTPLLYTSRDLDPDAHIWAFFQAHPRP